MIEYIIPKVEYLKLRFCSVYSLFNETAAHSLHFVCHRNVSLSSGVNAHKIVVISNLHSKLAPFEKVLFKESTCKTASVRLSDFSKARNMPGCLVSRYVLREFNIARRCPEVSINEEIESYLRKLLFENFRNAVYHIGVILYLAVRLAFFAAALRSCTVLVAKSKDLNLRIFLEPINKIVCQRSDTVLVA